MRPIKCFEMGWDKRKYRTAATVINVAHDVYPRGAHEHSAFRVLSEHTSCASLIPNTRLP